MLPLYLAGYICIGELCRADLSCDYEKGVCLWRERRAVVLAGHGPLYLGSVLTPLDSRASERRYPARKFLIVFRARKELLMEGGVISPPNAQSS